MLRNLKAAIKEMSGWATGSRWPGSEEALDELMHKTWLKWAPPTTCWLSAVCWCLQGKRDLGLSGSVAALILSATSASPLERLVLKFKAPTSIRLGGK